MFIILSFSFVVQSSVENDASKVAEAPKVIQKRALPSTERAVRGDSQPLSKSVRMEDLRKFFHLPIVEVARQLGTCTTALKKICRKNKINKWPYRQIRSITKSIQSLEMASLNDTLPEELRIQYRQQIVTLQNAIDELIKDPNGVIQLVNMGLSEEALQHLRESNAASMMLGGGDDDDFDGPSDAVSQSLDERLASAAGASVLAASSSSSKSLYASLAGATSSSSTNNGGAHGVLNLLQWPKPSADVQQIMQAAAQLTTHAVDPTTARRSSQKAKRKATEAGLDGTSSSSLTANLTNAEDSHLVGTNASPREDIPGGEKHPLLDGSVLDLNLLEGGNLRHKKVEIGDTLAECNFVLESQKMVFTGPVLLAPLQRKKLKPNITRKVVPLMEPDIGSNFGIEFIPQFILNILHNAIGSGGGMSESHRQMLLQQQQQQQQAQNQHHSQQQAESSTSSSHYTQPTHPSDHINTTNNNSTTQSGEHESSGVSTQPYAGGEASYSNNSSSSDLAQGYAYQSNTTETASQDTAASYANPSSHNYSTTTDSAPVTTSTQALEPAASQAAAHLVSLNNTV